MAQDMIHKNLERMLREQGRYEEFVERRAREDRAMRAEQASLALAQAPLLADLQASGCHVSSVWDLVNRPNDYTDVLPVLLKHLTRAYPDKVLEGIARSLATREAKFAWPVIHALYKHASNGEFKDSLAVALAGIASQEDLGEVLSLVVDTRHGPSRILFLRVITRSRSRKAAAVLKSLANDPDLKIEIARLLRRRSRPRRQ